MPRWAGTWGACTWRARWVRRTGRWRDDLAHHHESRWHRHGRRQSPCWGSWKHCWRKRSLLRPRLKDWNLCSGAGQPDRDGPRRGFAYNIPLGNICKSGAKQRVCRKLEDHTFACALLLADAWTWDELGIHHATELPILISQLPDFLDMPCNNLSKLGHKLCG